MTIIEKVFDLVTNHDWSEFDFSNNENASPEKLIIMAYYIGKESATKDVSNKYNKLIKEQRERANKCRYNKMANKIIGNQNYIYSSDYDGGMTTTFGNDLA